MKDQWMCFGSEGGETPAFDRSNTTKCSVFQRGAKERCKSPQNSSRSFSICMLVFGGVLKYWFESLRPTTSHCARRISSA